MRVPRASAIKLARLACKYLRDFGFSVSFYALYLMGLNVTLATIFLVSALVIVIRKPDDWLALFVAVMLVTFGTITFSDTMTGLTATYPGLWLPTRFIAWFGDVAIMLFFFIFPTGQFVPRWTWFVLVLWAVMQGCRLFFPETPFNLQHSARPLYTILFSAGLASGMFAQLYRYRRISGPEQRQQTKWIVFSVILALGGLLLLRLPFQGFQSEEHLPLLLALGGFQTLFILLIPISIAVAVIRYRLWGDRPDHQPHPGLWRAHPQRHWALRRGRGCIGRGLSSAWEFSHLNAGDWPCCRRIRAAPHPAPARRQPAHVWRAAMIPMP